MALSLFNQNTLLLLPERTLKQNEFQRALVSCRCLCIVSFKDGNIESNFQCILGDAQTISERRTNQNAWGMINKSEISCMIRPEWWITPVLLYFLSVLLNERMHSVCVCVSSLRIISPRRPVQHAVHQQTASCPSIKPCDMFHPKVEVTTTKQTTSQTAVRPNHYLAVVAKPCQSEAPNILLPSHI